MKKFCAILSLIIGLIGLGVFSKPVIEIICGVGGLILALVAKNPDAGSAIKAIRNWGSYLAWINILWVCLEFVLKFFGINLF